MPLEAIAINDFTTLLIKEPKQDNELIVRLSALYDQYEQHESYDPNDQHNKTFSNGDQAVAYYQQAFDHGVVLYVGMFNDKPICAVGCFPTMNSKLKQLNYLVMHPANYHRGIENQFIKLVLSLRENKDITFVSSNDSIQTYLDGIE